MIRPIPQVRTFARIGNQIADVPSWRLSPKSACHSAQEHIADVPAPQRQEKLVEVIQPIPQARTFARISDQIADVPVPLVPERLGEVVEVVTKERLPRRTGAHR